MNKINKDWKPVPKVTPKIYNPPVWPWGKSGIHNPEVKKGL